MRARRIQSRAPILSPMRLHFPAAFIHAMRDSGTVGRRSACRRARTRQALEQHPKNPIRALEQHPRASHSVRFTAHPRAPCAPLSCALPSQCGKIPTRRRAGGADCALYGTRLIRALSSRIRPVLLYVHSRTRAQSRARAVCETLLAPVIC